MNVPVLGWALAGYSRIARYVIPIAAAATCATAEVLLPGQTVTRRNPQGINTQWYRLAGPHTNPHYHAVVSPHAQQFYAMHLWAGATCGQLQFLGTLPDAGGCLDVEDIPLEWLRLIGVDYFGGTVPASSYALRMGPDLCSSPSELVPTGSADLLVLGTDGVSRRMRPDFDAGLPDVMRLTEVTIVPESWTELAAAGTIEPD